MDTTRRLWLGLAALMLAGFGVLLWMGWDIHLQAPPVPERVVSDRGDVVYTREDIELGRRVWQSIGGQQLGSIWGHGALVAPDWSADWLHREAEAMLDLGSRADEGLGYAQLDPAAQAAEQSRLRPLMRSNTYDPASGDLVVGERRAQAIAQVAAHYESLFSNDPATAKLRESYAMREDTPINFLRIDEAVETEQIERVRRFKASRDMAKVERRLEQLAETCAGGGNVMPVLVDAVKDYASLGEISDVYRRVFGLYREPIIF